MVNIYGYELDLVSFIPAAFGVLLSIYNWLKARQPANIHANEFFEYGLLTSSYYERMMLILPLIFDNSGKKKGMIKQVKIGFKCNNVINYIDIDGKVKLTELSSADSDSIGWDNFHKEGYQLIKPTYPIIVEPDQSTDVVLISEIALEDDLLPLDQDLKCIIEVYFRKKKMNKIEIPFYLSSENVGEDEDLLWLKPTPTKRETTDLEEEE